MEPALASRETWLASELPGDAVPQCAAAGGTRRAARGGSDGRLSARIRAGSVLRRTRRVGVGGTRDRGELGAPGARGRWTRLRRVEGRRRAWSLRRLKR